MKAATIALAIPHAAWLADRCQTMARLKEQLGNRPAFYREFTDRAPNWVWSEELWSWGLGTGADYLLQLQDDVIVDPKFWPYLRMMLDAVPDQIIGLETAHPLAMQLHSMGHEWCTTSEGLVGVGYVIPQQILGEFILWRSKLSPAAIQNITEDTLIDVFCVCTGRRVWHPIPTIIDHDVEVRSIYGNDHHSNRRPSVTTLDGVEPKDWSKTSSPPHLGTFYGATVPRLAEQWVHGFTPKQEADDVRSIISNMIASGKNIAVCCMCGREKSLVNGMTGVALGPSCIGASAQAACSRLVMR